MGIFDPLKPPDIYKLLSSKGTILIAAENDDVAIGVIGENNEHHTLVSLESAVFMARSIIKHQCSKLDQPARDDFLLRLVGHCLSE